MTLNEALEKDGTSVIAEYLNGRVKVVEYPCIVRDPHAHEEKSYEVYVGQELHSRFISLDLGQSARGIALVYARGLSAGILLGEKGVKEDVVSHLDIIIKTRNRSAELAAEAGNEEYSNSLKKDAELLKILSSKIESWF